LEQFRHDPIQVGGISRDKPNLVCQSGGGVREPNELTRSDTDPEPAQAGPQEAHSGRAAASIITDAPYIPTDPANASGLEYDIYALCCHYRSSHFVSFVNCISLALALSTK